MSTKKQIRFDVVWGKTDDVLCQSAMDFWKKEGVIVKEDALAERSRQLVMVARNTQGDIIGTSTALKTKVKLLNNNWLYQYRCYISPKARAIGLDVHLTRQSLNVLENASAAENEKAIGVFAVIENQGLMNNKIHNAAVWRSYKMYFIGFNSKDQPIRVYYFKGARI